MKLTDLDAKWGGTAAETENTQGTAAPVQQGGSLTLDALDAKWGQVKSSAPLRSAAVRSANTGTYLDPARAAAIEAVRSDLAKAQEQDKAARYEAVNRYFAENGQAQRLWELERGYNPNQNAHNARLKEAAAIRAGMAHGEAENYDKAKELYDSYGKAYSIGKRTKDLVQGSLKGAADAIGVAFEGMTLGSTEENKRAQWEMRQMIDNGTAFTRDESGDLKVSDDYKKALDTFEKTKDDDAVLTEEWSPALKRSREHAEQVQRGGAGLHGAAAKGYELGASMLGNAGSMALGLVPGVGMGLSLGTLGLQAAGSRLDELSARDIGVREAVPRAAVSGGIEVGTELLPIGEAAPQAVGKYIKRPVENWLKIVKEGGEGLLQNMAEQALGEATEEGASYVLNYLADLAYKDPEAEFSWAELADNMLMGAASGGVYAAIGTGINRALGGGAAVPENPAYRSEQTNVRGEGVVNDGTIQAEQAAQAEQTRQFVEPLLQEIQERVQPADAQQEAATEDTLRQIAAERQMVEQGASPDEAAQAYTEQQALRAGQEAVAGLAESGRYNEAMRTALLENYNGVSPDIYAQAMDGMYRAGQGGVLEYEQARRALAAPAAVVNNDNALQAAFAAGRGEAVAASDAAAPAVEGKLSFDSQQSAADSAPMLETMAAVANKLGVDVKVVQQLTDGSGNEVNGSWAAGLSQIALGVNSGNQYQTLVHELTHWMGGQNPEGLKNLQTAVTGWYAENVGMTQAQERVFDAYGTVYGSESKGADEAARDLLAGIMSTDEGVEKFCRYVTEADSYTTAQKRSILQTLRDMLATLVAKIKAMIRRGDATQGAAEGRKLAETAEAAQEASTIIDEFLAELTTARKNAAEKGGNVQVEQTEQKYSYAGQRAESADTSALQEAQRMEKEGAEAEDIRKQTGWFRGADRQWRFEIDDSATKFYRDGTARRQDLQNNPAYKEYKALELKYITGEATDSEFERFLALENEFNAERKTKKTLADYLYAPELYAQYPEAADIKVDVRNMERGDEGSFDGNTLQINSSLMEEGKTEYARSVLLHEVQHWIQSKEGFAPGASPEYWQDVLDAGDGFDSLQERHLKQEMQKMREEYSGIDGYRYELQNTHEDKEKLYRRAAEDGINEDALETYTQLYDALYHPESEKRSAYQLYRDTAGEIEARDTQSRMYYDKEKRSRVKPHTQYADTVFVNPDAGTRFSLKVPVEETKDLVAVHNVDESSLEKSLELGGLPMPSAAIVKAAQGHSKYGPISLVFDKNSIDPQTNRENKVYGGDGWTPTKPQVEYRVNEDAVHEVERRIGELSGKAADGAFESSSLLRKHGIEETTAMDAHEIAKALAGDDTARAAYLAEQEKNLEPVMKEKQWNKYGNETLQKFVNEVGAEKLQQYAEALQAHEKLPSEAEDTVRGILREYYREHFEGALQRQAKKLGWDEATIREKREQRADRSMGNVTTFTLEDFVTDAWKMLRDGGKTKGEIDRYATSEKLRSAVDDADVARWLEGQLGGVLGESGIYNGKERYTAMGDKRSFASLHYPVTLENIVRAMKETQQERGEGVWGVTANGLQSVSTREYGSIEDIRKNKGRLGSVDSESYKARVEAVDKQIDSVIGRIRQETKAHSDNLLEETNIIGNVIMQAAGKDTPAKIRSVFAGEGYTISTDTAKQLLQLYKDAASLPTEYFEAKPRRAVGFDEVKYAIVPDNASDTVLEKLQKLGVPILQYEAGNEDARRDLLNSLEDVKFSRNDAAEQIVAEATEKDQLKRQLRESETERKKLTRKAANAQKHADYWRQETRLTHGHLVDDVTVRKTAREFLNEHSSKYNRTQFTDELNAAYNEISKSLANGGSTEEALETLTSLARSALKESRHIDTELRDYYAPVRQALKEVQFEVQKNSPQYYDMLDAFGDGSDGKRSWGNVRRNLFGRIRVRLVNEATSGTLDTAFIELAGAYPNVFDESAHPVDNIRAALQVFESSKPQFVDVYGNDLDAAAALAGQELMDAYLATPTRETRADKKLQQLQQTRKDLRAQQRAALSEQKKQYDTRVRELEKGQVARKAELKQKYLNATRAAATANNAETAQRYRTLADGYQKQLADLNSETSTNLARKVLEQRAAYEVMNERRKDAIVYDRARDSVQKNVKQLYKWLRDPKEQGHVQTRMETAVYDLLTQIDPSTSLDGTKTAARWQETMKDIQLMAQQSLNADKGLADADTYADFDPDLPESIKELLHDAGSLEIRNMNGRQTQMLADILTSMKTSILNANRMMSEGRSEAVQAVAENSIREMEKVRESQLKTRNKTLGKLAENNTVDAAAGLLGLDMMDARRYFDSLGETACKDVYAPIRDGFDKRVWKLQEAQDKFSQIKGDADISKWTGDKAKKQEFVLTNGRKLRLTVGQMMEIYNLTQRKQAHEHLVQGGISLMENGRKGDRIRLTVTDLANITSALTNEQVKMARAMAEYLSDRNGPAGWGNEVTQKLYGLDKFTERGYWPIKTDANFNRTSDANADTTPGLYAIKNQGFTKALQRGANNPLLINDAFDTWCDHVANMATYNAWAIPLSDAMKWYNYRGENEISTKEAIDGIYGAKGKKYFVTLMQDINGVSAGAAPTGFSRLTKGVVRNWKVAKVGANLRVAIQQPTAYTRAAAVIDPKYLAAALGYDVGHLKQGMDRAESHCGIAKWKSWGYFETNIGQTMKSVLTGESSTLDKVREISTLGAEWGDRLTWGTLWNACELEAKDKGMTPGSEESLSYCAKRLGEIVDKTQVVDSVLHRSQIMRSKDMLAQMATNFFAEPTKTYNMLTESAIKLAHGEKGAAAEFGRNLATFFLTAFGTAAAASLVDAWRVSDDDKDKDAGERYLEALWDGFVDNINLLNNIPFIKDIVSIFDGYDATRTDMEAATDFYKAATAWQKFLAGGSKGTPYKLIYKTATAFADITGIPTGTAVREIKSAYDMLCAMLQVQDPLRVDDAFADTMSKVNSRLTRGQPDDAQEVLDKVVEQKLSDGKTEKEARTAVRSSLTSYWKKLYIAADESTRAEIAAKLLRLRVNGQPVYEAKDLANWLKK